MSLQRYLRMLTHHCPRFCIHLEFRNPFSQQRFASKQSRIQPWKEGARFHDQGVLKVKKIGRMSKTLEEPPPRQLVPYIVIQSMGCKAISYLSFATPRPCPGGESHAPQAANIHETY